MMLHEFKAGTLDASKCIHCKRTADMHNCDVCGKEVSVQLKYGNMLMCANCIEVEERLEKENNTPEKIAERVEAVNKPAIEVNQILKQSRDIDNTVQVNTDIFNAATVAITDLKKAIDEDINITNKPYALASELKARFERFQTAIFDAQRQIVESTNNQRAIQSYLNQLANQLRAEEREKLKIQDLSYQPKPAKAPTVKSISTNGTRQRKTPKAEIERVCKQYEVPEHMVVLLMKGKGIVAEDAARTIRKSLDMMKAEK